MDFSPPSPDIATAPLSKSERLVDGKRMAFHERGQGDAIVFLHGNPTSSYLWRNIVPYVAEQGRCIVPDLVGHGDSDKLDDVGPTSYSFVEHRHYLDGLLDELELGDRVTLVLHDWGSALGFDWADHHRDRVRGIAYMEGLPRPFAGWEEWSKTATPIFQGFRSDKGEEMILDRNAFVERVLPGSVLRKLSEAEMTEYRKPFLAREDRWPTLTWPRQIPIAGEPVDVVQIAADYSKWMAENNVPKLFVNAEPGAILIGPVREFCRTWKNQTEVTVPGVHFVQEDSGPAIGRAVAAWMQGHSI